MLHYITFIALSLHNIYYIERSLHNFYYVDLHNNYNVNVSHETLT